jgi:thiamine biosynthesis protein ThiS
MQLILNGEKKQFDGVASVAQLVEALGLNLTQIAVERNGAIVPKSAYGAVALDAGDNIEIVQFIGGG